MKLRNIVFHPVFLEPWLNSFAKYTELAKSRHAHFKTQLFSYGGGGSPPLSKLEEEGYPLPCSPAEQNREGGYLPSPSSRNILILGGEPPTLPGRPQRTAPSQSFPGARVELPAEQNTPREPQRTAPSQSFPGSQITLHAGKNTPKEEQRNAPS